MSADPLYYPFPRPPAAGELQPVAPGVYGLRMPLPFALDHINLWLLEDGDGWTLVDCGIGTPEVKAIWQQLLSGPLAGRPLKRIIVTHFHPDHIGLAGWLSRLTRASVLMTQAEWELASWLHAAGPERNARLQGFFSAHGVPDFSFGSGSSYRDGVPELPRDCQLVADGERLSIGGRCWQVVVGRGHSPEQLCLYSAELNLLIAGDQVLPRISPNISVSYLDPDADPLRDYLDTLERLLQLPESVRVLPAHGPVFEGLPIRLAALRQHHQERLELLLEACRRPHSGAETLALLWERSFDTHELFFALGEAVAHLHRLWADGLLIRRSDPGGITRFIRSGI